MSLLRNPSSAVLSVPSSPYRSSPHRTRVSYNAGVIESAFLSAIVDYPDHAVSVTDAQGRVVFMNQLAHDLMALPVRSTQDYRLKPPFGVFLSDKKTKVAFKDYPTIRALRGEVQKEELRWV